MFFWFEGTEAENILWCGEIEDSHGEVKMFGKIRKVISLLFCFFAAIKTVKKRVQNFATVKDFKKL